MIVLNLVIGLLLMAGPTLQNVRFPNRTELRPDDDSKYPLEMYYPVLVE